MNTRKKGNRLEFETQRWMGDRQVNFRRRGMSGQLRGLKGDFEWIENGRRFIGEAKSGNQVPKTLYEWLGKDKSDFLVIRRDRKERLWIINDSLLKVLLK